ncbi:MAG TPA: (Fe-S)-binding protein [Tenuifilaceae bacterium]|nr:(Fe-S)-binding protein [Tenuifilaceae bacterium]
METVKIEIPVMADLFARGEKPEYLFWVGCTGAYDDRYKKVAGAFAKILTHLKVSFAVLGKEETCTGDPARRAGNEMLYQMQAFQNIEIFKMYEVGQMVIIFSTSYISKSSKCMRLKRLSPSALIATISLKMSTPIWVATTR